MNKMIIAIAMIGVCIVSISGTTAPVLDPGGQFVSSPNRVSAGTPHFPLAADWLWANAWFEQTVPILGQALYGIHLCAGDSEEENGNDKKSDDKSDESGGGPDRLWDVVLYG